MNLKWNYSLILRANPLVKFIKGFSLKKIIRFMKRHDIFLILFVSLILVLVVKGYWGNPNPEQLNQNYWKENGPFELSPERGRFALIYSLAEKGSLYFPISLARFATPDLGYINGNYVSLFAPGVSFLATPGYIVGRLLGVSQVGAYLTISFFALINFFLIKNISYRLGVDKNIANIASIIFLFASPAFAYASTLYQHHISTFLILMSIYLLIKWNNFWSLFVIWFLCAASIPIDYPNLFLMFPIGFYALFQKIIIPNKESIKQFVIEIKFLRFFSFFGALIPLLFFLGFNYLSYSNPLQFSGTVASVKVIDQDGNPDNSEVGASQPEDQQKSAIKFFDTRLMTNGLRVHFLGKERGILWYAPVLLLSIGGIILMNKQRPRMLSLLVGVIGVNVFLYSMWGDPWGGWAFGSRYLIPSYALASILVGYFISNFRRSKLILFIVLPFLIYSLVINTSGALTTNSIPPKNEAIELQKISGKEEKYSYDRNFEYLNLNGSKSFVFNRYFSETINGLNYYLIILFLIFLASGYNIILFLKKQNTKNENLH